MREVTANLRWEEPANGAAASVSREWPREAGRLESNLAATLKREWLFFGLLAAYGAIFLGFYPPSFGIGDESEILRLAYTLAHGTIHPDVAGVLTHPDGLEFLVGGHWIVKFSPFNAALYVPALALYWKAAFLVPAAFFVVGALTLRSMLKREGLASEWALVYFLLPGMLYYASTLKESVGAAVMGLIGVAMLGRERPRAILGGLSMGAAVLLHPWMAAMVLPYAAVWWWEQGARNRLRYGALLALGAAPAIVALATYDRIAFGSSIVIGYVAHGEAFSFNGAHFSQYLPFYIASLGIFPIAGWAAFSPRWSKGWATPAAAAAVVLVASLYNYRDGINTGLSGPGWFIAAAVPGQRFLLPVSLIACLPASRWLDAHLGASGFRWTRQKAGVALVIFVAGYTLLSALHQNFLRANAIVQRSIAAAVPERAVLVGNDEVLKQLAPVYRIVDFRPGDLDESLASRIPDAYVAWFVAPGETPPAILFAGRRTEIVRARSFAWNRDLWIGIPADRTPRKERHLPSEIGEATDANSVR